MTLCDRRWMFLGCSGSHQQVIRKLVFGMSSNRQVLVQVLILPYHLGMLHYWCWCGKYAAHSKHTHHA